MHPGQVRAVHATPACSRLQRDSQAPKKTYPHVASAGGNSNSGSRNKQTRHGTEGGNTHEGVCPQPASPFPQPASPCPALPQLQLLPQPNPVCTNGSNTESSTSDPGWCASHTHNPTTMQLHDLNAPPTPCVRGSHTPRSNCHTHQRVSAAPSRPNPPTAPPTPAPGSTRDSWCRSAPTEHAVILFCSRQDR